MAGPSEVSAGVSAEPLPERCRCTRLSNRMRGRIISWTLPRRNDQVPAVVVDSEKKRMLPTQTSSRACPRPTRTDPAIDPLPGATGASSWWAC